MNPGFFERLEDRARQTGSLLCVGLDPRAGSAGEARDSCLRLIDETASLVAAFKPNSAFFEALPGGMEALAEVIGAVPDEIPVVLDAKRGDIASTAAAYATAVFEVLGAGAVTLSPYVGADSIDPFLAHAGRGVFVLCRTSNPGGAELQETLLANGEPLYLAVARAIAGLPADRAGLVVGATEPAALQRVRAAVPEHWILAPGVGAQGGSLVDAISAGVRGDGLGMLVPVSRSVADSADRAGTVADLNAAITAAVARPAPHPTAVTDPLATDLFDTGCIGFGDFELKSGRRSPVYVDLRSLVGHPEVLRRVARRYLPLLGARSAGSSSHRIAGVPLAGLPIATAVALESGLPMVYPRPEIKDHGTRSTVEGPFDSGDEVVIVDDVATSGISILGAAERLRAAGLVVESAVVLVDRGGGASGALAEEGITLHSVTTLASVVDALASAGRISQDAAAGVREFLAP